MCKVSVLISAYNVEDFVVESLQSIVDQTHKDIEIIIVDDGSTDETLALLKTINDPRIRLSAHENIGRSARLNQMLDIATGEFVLLHDADDISKPNRVERLLTEFKADPELAMAMSSHCLIINDKQVAPRPKKLTSSEAKEKINQFKMPAHDPTLMVKTSIAKQVGFDTHLYLGEGLDFILKIGEQHKISVVDDILYAYRVNPNSITKRNAKDKLDQLLYVNNCARQRRNMPAIDKPSFYQANKPFLENKDNNLSGHFTESCFLLVGQGQRYEAIKVAFFSLKYLSLGIRFAKPSLYALLPKFLGQMGRRLFGR